jgi:alpha-galactosidase
MTPPRRPNAAPRRQGREAARIAGPGAQPYELSLHADGSWTLARRGVAWSLHTEAPSVAARGSDAWAPCRGTAGLPAPFVDALGPHVAVTIASAPDAAIRFTLDFRLYADGCAVGMQVTQAPALRRVRLIRAGALAAQLRQAGGRDPRWLSLAYCSAHSSSPLSRSSVRPIEPEGKRRDGWWGTAAGASDGSGVVIFPLRCEHFTQRFAVEQDVFTADWSLEGTAAATHQPLDLDPFWISLHPDHLGEGLEAAASRFASPGALGGAPPAGWGSWDAYRDRFTDADILQEGQHLARLARGHLPRTLVEIDNGWEQMVGPARPDTTWESAQAFSSNLTFVVEQLRRQGHRTGLWIIPFVANEGSALVRSHPEFLVRGPDGEPHRIGGHGKAYCIDPTHPGARGWLLALFRRLASTGISYVKCDYLRCLLAPEPDDPLDGIEVPRRYHAAGSRVEAYRAGLALLREGFGPDITLMACSAPLGPTMGLADVVRIGPDISPTWESDRAGFRVCAEATAATAFLHGRGWIGDPDYLVLPHDDVDPTFWSGVIALAGGSTLASMPLGRLGTEDLSRLRLLWPPTNIAARPLDLFTHGPRPSWWYLAADPSRGLRRPVLGVLNWDDGTRDLTLPMASLGLNGPHHVVEAWSGAYLGIAQNVVTVTVKARASAVLTLTPVATVPHVIATDRHFTQGSFDLRRDQWEQDRGALSVESHEQVSAAGMVLVAVPDGWQPAPGTPVAGTAAVYDGGTVVFIPWPAGARAITLPFATT